MTIFPLLLQLSSSPALATAPIHPQVIATVPVDLTAEVPPNVVPWAFVGGFEPHWLELASDGPYEVSEESSLADLLRIWDVDGHEVPADTVFHGPWVSLHPHELLPNGLYVLSEDPPDLPIIFEPSEARDREDIWFRGKGSRFVVRGQPDHTPPRAPVIDVVVWTREKGSGDLEHAEPAPGWSVGLHWAPVDEYTVHIVSALDGEGQRVAGPARGLNPAAIGLDLKDLHVSPATISLEIQAMDLAGNLSEPVQIGPDDGLYQIESPGCSHVRSASTALSLWLPLLGLWGFRRSRSAAPDATLRTG